MIEPLLHLCGCRMFTPPGCVGGVEGKQCLKLYIAKKDPDAAKYHEELQKRWIEQLQK